MATARQPQIVCEGWRFIPQSFALVNEFQILALLDIGASVAVRDWPYIGDWKPVHGILPGEHEARLKALAMPGATVDAVIRVAAPYDFTSTPGVPTLVMVTSETGLIRSENVAGNILIGEAVAASDALVHAPSRWSRDGLVANGIPAERITVIGHGVDPGLYRPPEAPARVELRQRFGWTDDFVFLNVGAMTGNKGIDLLLAGFAEVLESFPNARLVLKGLDAIFRSREIVADLLNALPAASRSRVAERLTYFGHSLPLADMVKLYQSADAYVSPYRGEGFNLPVLEAAACGLPVICTKGGATDDFTVADFALRVDAAFDPARRMLEPSVPDLVAQMRRSLEDEPWHLAARRAGPAHVAAGHTWRHAAADLLRAVGLSGAAR